MSENPCNEKLLYKYMTFKNFCLTVCNSKLHFSSPIQFNDFFDTFVAIDCSSYEECKEKDLDHTIQMAIPTYILSLSRVCNNWVMWNMYTVDEKRKTFVFNEIKENNIKKAETKEDNECINLCDEDENDNNFTNNGIEDIFGVCLGFKISYKKNGKGGLYLGKQFLYLNAVKYENNFVKIHNIGNRVMKRKPWMTNKELIKYITHKAKEWNHEEEERIVLIPKSNQKRFTGKFSDGIENDIVFRLKELQGKVDSSIYSLPNAVDIPLKKDSLKEVIFGYRTSETRKKFVKCLLNSLGYNNAEYKEVVSKRSDKDSLLSIKLSNDLRS